MTAEAPDVIVVGDGIIGLLSALRLRQKGLAVMLFGNSRQRPPASWAGGGILSPLYPWRYPSAVTALAHASLQDYSQLAGELDPFSEQVIELTFPGMRVLDEPNPEEALAWARTQQIEVQLTEEQDLWMPSIGAVRNPGLLTALYAALRAQEVVLQNLPVTGIEPLHKGYRIKAGQQQWHVPNVVIAAGVWSKDLLSTLGATVDVRAVKGQMLRFQTDHPPRSILLGHGGYLIPRADGSVLAGSTLEVDELDQRPNEPGYHWLLSLVERLLPKGRQWQPLAHWSGLRPWLRRDIPLISEIPASPGCFVATGHYRNGLVCAPATARLLSELIMAEKPFLDPSPYTLS